MASSGFSGGSLSIRNLSYRLRKYKDLFPRRLEQALKENADFIIDTIKESQLYDKGIDGRGRSLGHYSLSTLKYKREKAQKTSHVTLKDTGKFYESLYPVIDNLGFYIWSDEKITGWKREAAILISKYGPYILRLTPENLNSLIREKIKPFLQEKLKRYLIYGEDY